MSKTNLPETPKTEEVDLIQIFNLIGRGFKSLFKFIGDILKYIFELFIIFCLFIKRHILKIAIAAVIGFVAGTVADMFSKPYYTSFLTVTSNYGINSQLIENIRLYGQLAMQKDSVALSNALGILPEEAASINSITIKPKTSKNDDIITYDNFIKSKDSLSLNNLTFQDYQSNLDITDFSRFYITVDSSDPKIFKKIEDKIVDIPVPNYIQKLRKIELDNIEVKKQNIKTSLQKIDSLRKDYREIMLKDLDVNDKKTNTSANNIYLASDSQRPTREIDLFGMENSLNAELRSLTQAKNDREQYVNISTRFPESGIYVEVKKRNWYILGAIALSILFLLAVEFNKFLTHYEKKIKGDA